jgi:hypothetical protein
MKVIFNPLSNQFEMVTDTKEIRAVVMDVLRDVPLGGGGGGLQDAPSNGSLYGRQDGVWTIVPEGVTDHALLSNLDYASAAHTGFQETLTFPLAANLGGTGVANLAGSTLTLGAATSITGGGTVALGGYTLTVPATGTAALLATANVFTVPQMVDGTTDAIQLRVQGHSTQTANLQTWEDSAGTVLGAFTLTKGLYIGSSPSSYTSALTIRGAWSTTTYGMMIDFEPSITIAAGYGGYGMYCNPSTVTINNGLWAGFSSGLTTLSITGNATYYGFYVAQPSTKSGAGTFGSQYGMYLGRLSKAVTNYGIHFEANTTVEGTSKYGIYINNISGAATNNFAIYTNAGLNRLGDQLSIVGSADRSQLVVTGFTTQTLPVAHLIDNTAETAAIRNVLQLEARSTGTVAANFGVGLPFYAETATNSTYQQQGRIYTYWIVAANTTRTAGMVGAVSDYNGERIGWNIQSDGSVALLGFFGVAPVVRPTALTTQLTTITHTAPTPDYAIQDFVDVSLGAGWAFASHDEANTTLSVIANLQTRVSEIETKLVSLGLLT